MHVPTLSPPSKRSRTTAPLSSLPSYALELSERPSITAVRTFCGRVLITLDSSAVLNGNSAMQPCTTVILFWVRVPILSEQIAALPRQCWKERSSLY